MKKSIKELMKYANFLQEQIDALTQAETINNYVVYSDKSDIEVSDYSFEETNQKINVFNQEILAIRSAINKANQEIKIGIEDYTISDGLVRIAQLSHESNRLNMLASNKQKTRASNYSGTVEFTEYLYDVKEAQKLYLDTIEKIHALQTAIDKANILTEIEV